MNKAEWIELLEKEAKSLKETSCEAAQEKMINFFYDQEMERMNCFNAGEDVGYKEEMQELFSNYQGHYSYETGANFSTMALFETSK